jgi:hypothetical protein
MFQHVCQRCEVLATPWGYRKCVLLTGLGTQLLPRRETALFVPEPQKFLASPFWLNTADPQGVCLAVDCEEC